MQIKFEEKQGSLWYSYREEKVIRTYETSGKVPPEIQEKGVVAIQEYAKEKVAKEMRLQKEKAARDDIFDANPNFPVSVEHEDVLLEGRIVSAQDNVLTVHLEKPCQGNAAVRFGWASAMSGHYIFSGGRKFSEHALETAQHMLIDIYRRERHRRQYKKVVTLAEQLNKHETEESE